MQEEKVLEIAGVSKQYRLGTIGTGTLSGDLKRRWNSLTGKHDAHGVIGLGQGAHVDGEMVWALRGIDLSIFRGEVVGLIGKNGAGKSTLLKLLSRVTAPTCGRISIKGRMVSLLEVGTGMHPELTGRENVFLNGAILGMTKSEVERKFHEIVEFSGCENYIDTPVKRYSSGMKVRLGFSVAAFLEPEILIVDEVLAVGDVEFQKKAITRIREVSKGGHRTVIIVSHNMASVRSICSRCVLLEKGKVAFDGDVVECISKYLGYNSSLTGRHVEWDDIDSSHQGDGVLIKRAAIVVDGKAMDEALTLEDPLRFEIDVNKTDPNLQIDCTLRIFSDAGDFIASSSSIYTESVGAAMTTVTNCRFVCEVPAHFFNQGIYKFGILILAEGKYPVLRLDELFKVSFATAARSTDKWMGESRSLILPRFNWKSEPLR
jgi:lipopolysaccharide transport system ATP-binding protein